MINTLVDKFNNLHNKVVTREYLNNFHNQLFDNLPLESAQITYMWSTIGNVLQKNDNDEFKIIVVNPIASNDVLQGEMELEENEDLLGLGKAVTPNEIYNYITETVIHTIKKVGHLPWQREWEKTSLFNGKQAINFDSKKGYRGINYFLLNFEIKKDKDGNSYLVSRDLTNPYFLTFASIEKHGGKLKKGAKGNRVVYFTKLYTYSEKQGDKVLEFSTYNKDKFKAWILKNKSRLEILKRSGWSIERLANSYIPILKYYNVFSGKDITGIDFKELPKNNNVTLPEKERIAIADSIVENMPNPPKIKYKGDQPAYYPNVDEILMTPIEAFKNEQSFYSTLFHELTHSTGARKRLGRFGVTGGKEKSKTDYAFEELIAEMGAVFLCAESGILFSTLQNSAKYLKGWNSKLVGKMKEDNKFFFRASSKSQAAADYILDRDNEGKPAYLKNKSKPAKKKDTKPTKIPTLKTDFSNPKTYENDLDYETTKRSYEGYSFSPEKRAESEIKSWSIDLVETYNKFKKLAETENYSIEKLNTDFAAFYKHLLKAKLEVIRTRAGVMSTMITGSANFPVRKNQARINTYENKVDIYLKSWEKGETKIKNNIFPHKQIKQGDKNALAMLQNKLKHALYLREVQNEFNKTLHKNKASKEDKRLWLIEKNIINSYKIMLPNNGTSLIKMDIEDAINGNKLNTYLYLSKVINDTKKRIKAEELRENEIGDSSKEIKFNGGYYIKNAEDNRLQVFYDKKPSEEARTLLKKNGFRWSPKNKAWQRQLTRNAISVAQRLFKSEVKQKQVVKIDENGQTALFGASKRKKKVEKKAPTPKNNIKSKDTTKLVDEGNAENLKGRFSAPQFIPEPTEKVEVIKAEPKPIIEKTVEPTPVRKIPEPLNLKPISQTSIANHKYFNISGPLSDFLGKVEIKPVHSVAWTLDAPQGAGKTRAFFRAINEFSKNYKVLFVSAEEHPESALFIEKRDMYIDKENQNNVYAVDETDFEIIKELIPHFDIVFFDSWNKIAEKNKRVDFDNNLRKGFNGKLFACIFQRTVGGTMRGGSKAQFDGDIISQMVKGDTYKESYVKSNKNRYQDKPLNQVCWNIFYNEIFSEEALNGPAEENNSVDFSNLTREIIVNV